MGNAVWTACGPGRILLSRFVISSLLGQPGQISLSRFVILPLFRQPGQNLIHLTPYRAMVAVGEWRNSGVLDLHISGVHGRACPGSPKEAEIPNRDSRICPGSYVDRLTPPPGHQPRIDRTLQCLAGMTISDDTRSLVRFATTSAPSQCKNGIFSGVVSCRMRKILNQPPKRHIADSAELAGLRAMRSVVSECDSDNGRRQIAVSSH